MYRTILAVALAFVMGAAMAIPVSGWLLSSSRPRPATAVVFDPGDTGIAAVDVQGAITNLATRVKAVEASQAAAAAVQRTQVVELKTSSQEHASRIAGQEARVATLEEKVAESALTHSRINYAEESKTESLGADYARLRDLGTFSKRHATSTVTLVWNTHVEAEGESGTFCDFQLRIDGGTDTEWEGGGGRAVIYVPAGARSAATPVSVSTLFSKVGAGSHTVSVWVRGSGHTCRENYGNFPRSVLIEEAPRG